MPWPHYPKGSRLGPQEHRAKRAAALVGNQNTRGFKHSPEVVARRALACAVAVSGVPVEQLDTYRLYRRKRFTPAESRAACKAAHG